MNRKPRQKFYSRVMQKGCTVVAFYIYRNRRFGDAQVENLQQFAYEQFNDIPWQMVGPEGNKKPVQLFVWVEIWEDTVDCGLALIGDQIRVGHEELKRKDGHVPGIVTVRKALHCCAVRWRQRPDNRDDVDNFDPQLPTK